MFTYRAEVIDVKDGDTLVANIDLGFGIWIFKQTFRLAGINTPELKTEPVKAIAAKNKLKELVLNKRVTLITKKDSKEKYGRWLATILLEEDKNLIDINHKLVVEGFATFVK
jgi:micrococcal nuclease